MNIKKKKHLGVINWIDAEETRYIFHSLASLFPAPHQVCISILLLFWFHSYSSSIRNRFIHFCSDILSPAYPSSLLHVERGPSARGKWREENPPTLQLPPATIGRWKLHTDAAASFHLHGPPNAIALKILNFDSSTWTTFTDKRA